MCALLRKVNMIVEVMPWECDKLIEDMDEDSSGTVTIDEILEYVIPTLLYNLQDDHRWGHLIITHDLERKRVDKTAHHDDHHDHQQHGHSGHGLVQKKYCWFCCCYRKPEENEHGHNEHKQHHDEHKQDHNDHKQADHH